MKINFQLKHILFSQEASASATTNGVKLRDLYRDFHLLETV